jgi:hypothetical protein
MTTPWVPKGYATHPVVRIDAVPGIQLDFEKGPNGHEFADADCDTYGAPGILIGVQMCVKAHENIPRALVAGEKVRGSTFCSGG